MHCNSHHAADLEAQRPVQFRFNDCRERRPIGRCPRLRRYRAWTQSTGRRRRRTRRGSARTLPFCVCSAPLGTADRDNSAAVPRPTLTPPGSPGWRQQATPAGVAGASWSCGRSSPPGPASARPGPPLTYTDRIRQQV